MKVEFKDIYKIGIKKIDEQHKELFEMFNNLDYAIARGEGDDVIKDLLDFLSNYCQDHFKTEEMYFEKYHYPDAQAHKDIHQKFLNEIDELNQRYLSGYLKINDQVQSTLYSWLTSHIEQTDKRYGMYLIDKIKGNA